MHGGFVSGTSGMMLRSRFSVSFAACAGLLGGLLPGAVQAGDSWPQFRGLASGHTEARNLPLTWSESEHVKWKTPLPGEGWSSPVVANGQIWMTTALDEGASLRALCCD